MAPEPTLVLDGGAHSTRILFDCRACGTSLGLDPVRFTITMTVKGPTVSPEWFCPECGVRGTVRHGQVLITGRISIPPSGAKSATVAPGARSGVRVEKGSGKPIPEDVEPENCPERLRHGSYAKTEPSCPICGKRF